MESLQQVTSERDLLRQQIDVTFEKMKEQARSYFNLFKISCLNSQHLYDTRCVHQFNNESNAEIVLNELRILIHICFIDWEIHQNASKDLTSSSCKYLQSSEHK